MKQGKTQRKRISEAFTLVELLVVIAIIAVVAGLSVGVFAGANLQKVRMQTNAQMTQIQTGIDNYKSKFGAYPPSDPSQSEHELNVLFYELTGTYYNTLNQTYRSIFAPDNTLTLGQLTNEFGSAMAGLANAHAAGANPEPFATLTPKDYSEVDVNGVRVILLTVPSRPVAGGFRTDGNYWHYRAQPANGYNPTTYDLWAEVRGRKVNEKVTIGNWKTR